MSISHFLKLLLICAGSLANRAGGFLGVLYVGTAAGAPTPTAADVGKFAYFSDRKMWLSVRESTGAAGTYIYDRIGGGAIVADTLANIIAAYNMTTCDGCTFRVTDIGVNGMDFFATGGLLRMKNRSGDGINIKVWNFVMSNAWINFGGGSSTYVQADNTVTVTKTSHGLTSDFNGASIFLTGGTGTFTSETCTNFTYIDANSFSCTSATARTTSGNLGTNTAKTYSPWTYTYPTALIKKGDAISLGGIWRRVNNSANNKTLTCEFSGTQINTSARTTAGTWLLEASPSAVFTTANNKFMVSGVSTSETTDTNSTWAIASTLANAADWDLLMPINTNYISRSPVQ